MAQNLAHMRIRRLRAGLLTGLVGALLLTSYSPASAMPARTAKCRSHDSVIFAGGGTALTNGVFFPGTAIYDGKDFVGTPQVVPRGCNVEFVNLDPAAVTNTHQVISYRQRRGRPLFYSRNVAGPGRATVRTSHLKRGVYPYFCSVHYGMWGLLEIKNLPPAP